MTAYYNEIDRFNCDWLSNMMDANLITPGKIDDRSIVDVRPSDLAGFERVHFFAGIGGWDYSLNLVGWNRPVWTGSCPCQPFSLAGAQKGFDDSRHLWPEFKRLIAECNPPVVFGEQVASASQWLGLVRSDLEALGYAVGCLPIQAASAGADHLRDRYWFVADSGYGAGAPSQSGSSREAKGARQEDAGQVERHSVMADANDAGSQGRRVLPERAGERIAGADGLAYAAGQRGDGGEGAPRPSGRDGAEINCSDVGIADRRGWPQGQQATSSARHGGAAVATSSDDGDLANPDRNPSSAGRRDAGEVRGLPEAQREPEHSPALSGGSGDELCWVIGADGKARRVKPGIRLLAHGIPNRVGLLRGFGNAIDPRPAAEFIGAFMSTLAVTSQERA